MTQFDLEAIRYRLREKAPYFGTAIWRLRPVEDKDFGFKDDKGAIHGTFAVSNDGRLYYNPTVDWSFDECVGALCHEIHHLILRHHGRQNGRDQKLWNYAADLEINSALQRGGWTLPTRVDDDGKRVTSVLLPSQFGYAENLTAEAYYNLLLDDAVEVPQMSMAMPGAGKCGMSEPGGQGTEPGEGEGAGEGEGGGPALTDVELDGLAKRIAEEVLKSRGTVPASLERWADELLNPTVPWQSILRAYAKRSVNVVAGGASDYSFMQANERRSSSDLILPAMVTYKPEVGFLLDTSGSIGRDELCEMVTEIHGVVRHMVQRMGVVAYDAAPHETHYITNPRALLKLPLSGGGGTDMAGGLEYLSSTLRPRPNIVIVMTDGFTPWPDSPPRGTQVIVCITSKGGNADKVPAWAKVVQIGESRAARLERS